MEKINLLDLDNDVLNIIGDYVKADNFERIKEEEKQDKKMEIFKFVDENIKQLRIDAKKEKIKISKFDFNFAVLLIFDKYFVTNYGDNWKNDDKLHNEFTSIYEEYLKIKKLGSFSK